MSDVMARTEGREAGELGARLLVGRGVAQDPARGVALLREAVTMGDGEAAAVLATLTAGGAWTAQSWPGAIDLLEQASALGSRRAEDQLILLSGGDPATGRRAGPVHLAPWFEPPGRRVLCDRPRVRASDAFVSPLICDWMVRQTHGRLRPALMYHGDIKKAVEDPHRSCGDLEFDIAMSDVILILIRERIARATGVPTICMEPPRALHYSVGQEIRPHYDRLNDGVGDYGGRGYQGDRIVTFLLYLNDGYEGGELDFPKIDQRFRGVKGDAIYFAHTDESGKPEPLSLHAGRPIIRGEKYLLSQWIHDRPIADAPLGLE
jgi:hypothetical protein